MSIIRTSLTAIVFIVFLTRLTAATALNHPLYFEERAPGLFESRSAGHTVAIRSDRMEWDNMTLRFVNSSGDARIAGRGPQAPATYIARGQTRRIELPGPQRRTAGQIQRRDRHLALLGSIPQQQGDAVPITVNRMRARTSQAGKMIGEVIADDGSQQIDTRGLSHRERPFFDTGGTIREPYLLANRSLAAARIGSMKCR